MLLMLACAPTQIHITEEPADSSEVVSTDTAETTDTTTRVSRTDDMGRLADVVRTCVGVYMVW